MVVRIAEHIAALELAPLHIPQIEAEYDGRHGDRWSSARPLSSEGWVAGSSYALRKYTA